MKKLTAVCVIIAALTVFWVSPAHANGAFSKLGRGITNIFTGWIEIFTTTNKHFREHDNDVLQGIYAIPEGIVRSVIRTSVGVYETLTFPIPIPENFETIVEPEFVISSEDPYEKVYTNNEGPYN